MLIDIKYSILFSICAFVFFLAPLFGGGKKDTTLEQVESDSSANDISDSNETVDPKKIWYNYKVPQGEPVPFHEVWGYVMEKRESEYRSDMPITDLCYFGADINMYGEITHIPNPDAIKSRGFKGRTHLVVTCEGRSLSHLVLDPKFNIRKEVLSTLANAAKKYDGIQIDFELVPLRDAEHFRTFLTDLRSRIGNSKWLTVCLPARLKTDSIYPYEKIEPLVDRIIIMAYDQHWSTSAPGSIAEIGWCERIVDYAKTVIPKKKLVMGLPFYGRTWQDQSLGKAWYFSGVNKLIKENHIDNVSYVDDIPCFTFEKNIKVTGFFEDTWSSVVRLRLYASKDVDRIAFWRIGQEDENFWPWLTIQ